MTVGTHLLVTIKTELSLDTIGDVKPLMEQVISACDLHVVSQTGHQFEPIGATYVYVLSESHFSIHTYPEHKSAYLDIFCCDPKFDPDEATEIIKRVFQTSAVDSLKCTH